MGDLDLLNEVSRALDEPLALEARLQRVMGLVVPAWAQGCSVYLVSEDGRLERKAAAGEEGAALSLSMRAGGRVLGVISFSPGAGVALAQALADRTALAVETARLQQVSQQVLLDREHLMGRLSHDLRNPLSTVTMGTELLLRSAAPESAEKARRAAGNVQRAVARMERLLNDLSDLARIEAGGLRLEREDHDVARLVAEVIDLHSTAAAEKQLQLVNQAGASSPARVDRQRILQLFSNLLDNAFAVTPPGGSIRLGAERQGAEIRIWVDDDGPGVPEAQRSQLFQRNWRQERKNVGLGLAIVRGIVEAHGGRIWLEGPSRFVGTLSTDTTP